MNAGKPLTIVLLSGGTGRTCEQVVKAALAQFPPEEVRLVRKPHVRSVRSALRIVEQASRGPVVICHTLVAPRLREAVLREAERRAIPTIDILGPVLAALDDQLDGQPRNKPGLFYELEKEHFDRIDAADFTLAHDDGHRVHEIHLADVVLTGVSRVSKSVTCFALAFRGIRAANVPLLLDSDPPLELLRLNPHKVVGLTMNPDRLRHIREARVRNMRMGPVSNYVDRHEIARELRQANDLIEKQGWYTIDVSYKSPEEVAKEVIDRIPVRVAGPQRNPPSPRRTKAERAASRS